MSKEKKLGLEYVTDSLEVSSSTSHDLDITEMLGGVANSGWITSDDGAVLIQINTLSAQKTPLMAGDTLNFKKEDKWNISRVIITTTSVPALTVRYFLRKKVEIEL